MAEEFKPILEELVVTINNEAAVTIYSTLVGYYKNPPESNKRVRKGTPLGEIHQLGIEHKIESNYPGVVEFVLPDNKPVQYGEKILKIKVDRSFTRKILEAVSTIEDETSDDGEIPPGHFLLNAPFNCIFHITPNPSSPPYVVEGSAVEKNDVVCLLDCMKMYNEIRLEDIEGCSYVKARIVKIYRENHSEVSAGEGLILIGPILEELHG